MPDDCDAFDTYLDACLAGTADPPERFLADHPTLAPDERARIRDLWRASNPRANADADTSAQADSRRVEPPRSVPHADDVLEAAAERLPPCERLGDFELLRVLGEGGMGVVYLARQLSLDRLVAVKVVRPELADSPTAAARFEREVAAVARLRHPHIVTVLDVGRQGRVRWLAMELLRGRSLEDLLAEAAARGDSIEPRLAARWGLALAGALAAAHAQGVVHRDVKPGNVRITPEGVPMLLDFGLARLADLEGEGLTRSFAGSPLYAAPEQIAGAALDGRADVYALGALLYRCLVGRVPFPGGTLEEVVRRVLADDPVPPRRLEPTVPRDLETIVLKALEKDPARRYADATALADDLVAFLDGAPIRARPAGPLRRGLRALRRRPRRAAALVAGALLVAGAWSAVAVMHRLEADVRRADADAALAHADSLLQAWCERRDASADLEQRVAETLDLVRAQHLSRERLAALDVEEDRAFALRREREQLFGELLDELQRAERLDPARADVAPLRASAFAERADEARRQGDAREAAFWSGRAREADPDAAERSVPAVRELGITSDPPGAEVHTFVLRRLGELVPGGGPRRVPVPVAGASPVVPPGAEVLEVVRGVGPAGTGDLVTHVAGWPVEGSVLADVADGRPPARLVSIGGEAVHDTWEAAWFGAPGEPRAFVLAREDGDETRRATSLDAAGVRVLSPEQAARAGAVVRLVADGLHARDVLLPPGCELRRTATPAPLGPATLLGHTPLHVDVPGEELLLVLRHPDGGTARGVLDESGGRDTLHYALSARVAAPSGFVALTTGGTEHARETLIMEYEVTSAEYLAFLDDPETLAALAAGRTPPLVPRAPEQPPWPRDATGRFALPDGWPADWPVLGVSFDDAQAYARWRSAHDERFTYALPDIDDWMLASSGGTAYVFGDAFRPHWTKSCFSRPRPVPEPVGSHPVDRSLCGVSDLAGSVMEWLDDWWDEARGLRRLGGGSWAEGRPDVFRIWGGNGARPDAVNEMYGFRLVARPRASGADDRR